MEYFIELLLSGMVRGSIYALIALGYTMVYGIIQLINFAHGEIYMIGAFTALIVAGVLTLLGLNRDCDTFHRLDSCRRVFHGLWVYHGESGL